MNQAPAPPNATIIPSLRYRDAPAAIEWLCEAFGFTRHLVVEDASGGIAHAQLVFGNGMIMLGSARNDDFDNLQKPLVDSTAPVTQSPYIIVADVDAHHARAAIRKGICGILAATIPGSSRTDRRVAATNYFCA